jgi:hypothetical protein
MMLGVEREVAGREELLSERQGYTSDVTPALE